VSSRRTRLRVEERKTPEPKTGEVLVRLGAGGICGSDLHYYHDGGVADFRLREPMTLGHEVAGEIVAIGPGVTTLKAGDRVAVNPAVIVVSVTSAAAAAQIFVPRCVSSAALHDFRTYKVVSPSFSCAAETQCIRLTTDISFPIIACAEPLSVTLHAANQAGKLTGKTRAHYRRWSDRLLLEWSLGTLGRVKMAITTGSSSAGSRLTHWSGPDQRR